MASLLLIASLGAIEWQHPGGMVTKHTIAEVRQKLADHEWARLVYQRQKDKTRVWLDASSDELRRVFPTACGNVYHNFSCPKDRCRLTFDPFNPDAYACPVCNKTFPSDTDPGVYEATNRYNGDMYDGWACIFYQTAASTAAEFGLMGRIEEDDCYFERGIEILMLYANTIEGLPTQPASSPQMKRILTYHREGDNKVLFDLACAYELLRDHMTSAQRERFERVALQRMLDDIMLEPIYTYDHNNLYQWHRTIVQTSIALERADLIDWSFGFGENAPDKKPDHRSMRRLLDTHFKPDGAFWEMCSGYHMYPLYFLCEFAVLSHNLSAMDARRFPPEQYDLTGRDSAGGKVIHAALHWILSMAPPDRRMPTIGDSTQPVAGLDDYYVTAEVGYRFFGLQEVGDYPAYRTGDRRWVALLYGAPEIKKHATPFASAFLSSGWVSLRSAHESSRTWVGLNGLVPGGGHQHADRLSFLWHTRDTLLAVEKATPYNELTTRALGTLSPMHNTVTVDMVSQQQGEALEPEQTPQIAHFHAGTWLQFAEIRADNLHAQTQVYQRAVALVEDIAVDLFRVEGGETHDWMLHHPGAETELSIAAEATSFTPADWLYNGRDAVRAGKTDDLWNASWYVGDVTARLTMAGAPDTAVYLLETYPIANAVITPDNPPCQSLCVRRANDRPFLAVWDAWLDKPNMRRLETASEAGVLLRTGEHTYRMRFGAGTSSFSDGTTVTSDAVFACVRDMDDVVFVGGTDVRFTTQEGEIRVASPERLTVTVRRSPSGAVIHTSPSIQYDTYQGENHPREAPDVPVIIEGGLWD